MTRRPTDGIINSGRRILTILVRIVQTRLSLVAVELLQEQRRIWLILLLTGLALIFASMALLMLSILVIVAFWDEHRLLAIGGMLALYVLAATGSVLFLRYKAMGGSHLFSGSLDELAKDRAELERTVEDFEEERWRG